MLRKFTSLTTMQIKISFAAVYDFNQLIHKVCSWPRRFWPLPRPAPHCGEGGEGFPALPHLIEFLLCPSLPRPVKKISFPSIPDLLPPRCGWTCSSNNMLWRGSRCLRALSLSLSTLSLSLSALSLHCHCIVIIIVLVSIVIVSIFIVMIISRSSSQTWCHSSAHTSLTLKSSQKYFDQFFTTYTISFFYAESYRLHWLQRSLSSWPTNFDIVNNLRIKVYRPFLVLVLIFAAPLCTKK